MGITTFSQALGEVEFKRGIFQGDSLSTMKCVICMVPLSSMVRNEQFTATRLEPTTT